jgi:hypothetical protein
MLCIHRGSVRVAERFDRILDNNKAHNSQDNGTN